MVEWTDAARREFNAHFARQREALAAGGADPDEVREDMRRHIEEEAAAGGIGVAITLDDVRRVLARMTRPDPAPTSAPAQQPPPPGEARQRPSRFFFVASIIFGVLVPAATLGIEFFTGMCASAFFDPMPTFWHVAMVAWVPIANAVICAQLIRGRVDHPRRAGWINGLAIGIACYYAIVFIPFTPFAVLAVYFFGLGLLPLAPLLSLIVAARLRSALTRLAPSAPRPMQPRLLICILLVFATVFLLDAPKTITYAGLHMAVSEKPQTRVRGVRLLRRLGNRDLLLRACYVRNRQVADFMSFMYAMFARPLPFEDIRDTYYRVTGTPYNAVRPPSVRGIRGADLINANEFDFGQGGDAVAARVRGLSLKESRLDGELEADACTSYTEWTLVFRNASARQREARALVALPPGGVVSRLTLWIDGEEREAAYSGRNRVKAAYKRIVQRQRDPVLVTTAGPGLVLLQCFPVPPNGGTMKTRVGISAPLTLRDRNRAALRLPAFVERNFDIPEHIGHSVWFEGDGEFAPSTEIDDPVHERPQHGRFALRGIVPDGQLAAGLAVTVGRDARVASAWAEDARREGTIVQQTIGESAADAPDRIVFVIDGARRMQPHAAAIADAIVDAPREAELAVLLAGDVVTELSPERGSPPRARGELARRVREARYEGGCDNMAALATAWDMATAGRTNSAIVWLHATQPIAFADSQALEQRWQRRPNNPKLYDLQFGPGPNRIADQLEGIPAVVPVPRLDKPEKDLVRLLAIWSGTEPHLKLQRQDWSGVGTPPGKAASGHLVRLWANDRIVALSRSRREADLDEAVRMAGAYQLVTPVSGAVVLENMDQYKQAGLKPASPESSPAIVPEPETWALLLAGAAVMLLVQAKRLRWATVKR